VTIAQNKKFRKIIENEIDKLDTEADLESSSKRRKIKIEEENIDENLL
jgi:hypothetical protein